MWNVLRNNGELVLVMRFLYHVAPYLPKSTINLVDATTLAEEDHRHKHFLVVSDGHPSKL